MQKYDLFNGKVNNMLHGADYNPDQWLHRPDILEKDIELMKKANCNVMSLGIFSWSTLEPKEGDFQFEWLDQIIDNLYQNGISVILATPSGARPDWLAAKYPEVLRVNADRSHNLFGERHNHCYTSPVYREKIKIINRKLAERYGEHPAVIMWHVSNEYGGDCHCELCQQDFRKWLQNKYGSLENLNRSWWSSFWSHTYTNWENIESPAPQGMQSVHGLALDWKRFSSDQTIEFYKNEIEPLREITPQIPITTNFMYKYIGLNYWKFAQEVDVVSWDSYPSWHSDYETDIDRAVDTAFMHDMFRSLKDGKPFLLMESTPSKTNWQPVAKLKRPGMHKLSSLQAVAHGSDSVQYFQWRKSRGGVEKFHGSVVGHAGHENTRVFKDVAALGAELQKLNSITGTTVKAEVAVVFDQENRWAINEASGPRQEKKDYLKTCLSHYKNFWQQGVSVDIINQEKDFSQYKLVIAPMLYLLKENTAARLKKFVKNGGTVVSTYWTGIVNENDLCFLGGFPGPLRDLFGIWSEELDALYDQDSNQIVIKNNTGLKAGQEYEAKIFCDLIQLEGAEALAEYKSDFYAGQPALTVNNYGKGKAYYIASRNEDDFLKDFYYNLIIKLNLTKIILAQLPEGVTAQKRSDANNDYIFLMNFSEDEKKIELREELSEIIDENVIKDNIILKKYEVKIFKKKIL
ncbi:beta-galactosidase [Halanaerobium saccharolyticum]|uniref:Beta-galactosidase n=1 Tax=Halanaerobium saccharolyticum TaxID=43595 RepID=A0A4R7Z2E2_9FIRM|nr:beta-galactosidase [Halanaerobium saccharolyticum]RAK07864.1 beta-galactosidase [Halanaerobium saccharolyticum]TDW04478.1 beta-galactosidase [Halanaerobium saccharolyticum]TDX59814.1 beta-galactosidase [Halanaerobium saccharolyticum]